MRESRGRGSDRGMSSVRNMVGFDQLQQGNARNKGVWHGGELKNSEKTGEDEAGGTRFAFAQRRGATGGS